MVDLSLVRYISDSLKKGYTFPEIRQSLLQNNWNIYQVDEAIKYAYRNDVKTKIPLFPFKKHILITFIVVLTIFILLFGILAILPEPTKEEELEVSYTIQIINERIERGTSLKISSEATTTEIIYPTYEIYNSGNSIPILRWTETNGISPKENIEKKITLSSGNYILKSTATILGKVVQDEASFIVYEVAPEPTCSDGLKNQAEEKIDCGGPCPPCPSCNDGKKNQAEEKIDCGGPCEPCEKECLNCNDFNLCTKDLCNNGICEFEPIFPCCGNFICENRETIESCPADCKKELDKPINLMTRSEILDKLKTIDDQNEKGEFCDEITTDDIRDDCFRVVSYDTKNKIFCSYIISVPKKDQCYMEFAMAKDYSVCIKIENPYLKEACEALKKRP